MILDCPKYSDLRNFCATNLKNIVISKHPNTISKEMIMDKTAFVFLVIDPSWFRIDIGASKKGLPNILTQETADQLEAVS